MMNCVALMSREEVEFTSPWPYNGLSGTCVFLVMSVNDPHCMVCFFYFFHKEQFIECVPLKSDHNTKDWITSELSLHLILLCSNLLHFKGLL